MRKILVIAWREYRASVRSKAFIGTMVMMPILMGASIALQGLFRKIDDQKTKRYVLIDRSPDGSIAPQLASALDRYNEFESVNPKTGQRIRPKMQVEIVPPSENNYSAMLEQRFEQSQRIEQDEIDAFLEIGADVLKLRSDPNPLNAPEEQALRWYAKRPTENISAQWFEHETAAIVQRMRLAAENIDPNKVKALQQPIALQTPGLARKKSDQDEAQEANRQQQMVVFFLPGMLIGLMFVVIMVGATPAMQGIIEEKSQRIAEVLLGSVTPFQLMSGKLLGVVGVSLTMTAVYLIGGYGVAMRYELTDLLTPSLIAWFLLFLVAALLIYGSLFIAIGAAANDIKDTQALMMPLMCIACFPLLALGPIMLDPNGKIAVVCSLFPFASPMLLVARQSVPPGVPLWQMLTGMALVLATTLLCLWAAGRIFRVGILMQGKGARLPDLIRWIRKG